MSKPISIEKTVTMGAKITTVKGSSIKVTTVFPGTAVENFTFQFGDEVIKKNGKTGYTCVQFDKPYTGLVYGKVSPFSTDAKVVYVSFDCSAQYTAETYCVDADKIISVSAVTDPDSIEVSPAAKVALKLNMTVGNPQEITLEEGVSVTVTYKAGKETVTGDRKVTAFMYKLNQKFEPEFVGAVFAKETTVDEETTVTYEEVLFTDITSIVKKTDHQSSNKDPEDPLPPDPNAVSAG